MIADQSRRLRSAFTSQRAESPRKIQGNPMTSQKGPNIKKKQKCKNCEGKGLLKKGDRVVKCQRCGGTGLR
jgi:DnaJ-class molecular chaperone